MRAEKAKTQSAFSRVDSLGYKFYHLAHLFGRALDERLAKHGVTVGQFRLLLVLWEREHLTPIEIARYLDIEQPTVANTLKRMARDGLIETSPDPSDGRRTRIALTRRGKQLKGPLTLEAQSVNELAVKGLSPTRVAGLHEALDQLAAALTESES